MDTSYYPAIRTRIVGAVTLIFLSLALFVFLTFLFHIEPYIFIAAFSLAAIFTLTIARRFLLEDLRRRRSENENFYIGEHPRPPVSTLAREKRIIFLILIPAFVAGLAAPGLYEFLNSVLQPILFGGGGYDVAVINNKAVLTTVSMIIVFLLYRLEFIAIVNNAAHFYFLNAFLGEGFSLAREISRLYCTVLNRRCDREEITAQGIKQRLHDIGLDNIDSLSPQHISFIGSVRARLFFSTWMLVILFEAILLMLRKMWYTNYTTSYILLTSQLNMDNQAITSVLHQDFILIWLPIIIIFFAAVYAFWEGGNVPLEASRHWMLRLIYSLDLSINRRSLYITPWPIFDILSIFNVRVFVMQATFTIAFSFALRELCLLLCAHLS